MNPIYILTNCFTKIQLVTAAYKIRYSKALYNYVVVMSHAS